MTTDRYFNRKIITLVSPHVEYVVRETDDKIIIFGDYSYRFDVPKSGIKQVDRNVILNMDFSKLASKYKVDKNAQLPTGEPVVRSIQSFPGFDRMIASNIPQSNYYHFLELRIGPKVVLELICCRLPVIPGVIICIPTIKSVITIILVDYKFRMLFWSFPFFH